MLAFVVGLTALAAGLCIAARPSYNTARIAIRAGKRPPR